MNQYLCPLNDKEEVLIPLALNSTLIMFTFDIILCWILSNHIYASLLSV